MQPTWDALRQSGCGAQSAQPCIDATHMGCAEAKEAYHTLNGGTGDATHMGCAEAKKHIDAKQVKQEDATHMGCAEAKSTTVAYVIEHSRCNPHGMR